MSEIKVDIDTFFCIDETQFFLIASMLCVFKCMQIIFHLFEIVGDFKI